MRSSRSETRRRRQRNRRLTFIICIALAVIAVISAIVVGYGDVYRNEKQFKDFADSHFESGEMYDSVEIEKTESTSFSSTAKTSSMRSEALLRISANRSWWLWWIIFSMSSFIMSCFILYLYRRYCSNKLAFLVKQSVPGVSVKGGTS